jgi:hypothetical protein
MRNLKKLVMTGGMTAAVAVMALTGCKMMENSHAGGRTAGRVLDDKTITAKVSEKLENEPVYKFSNVDVKTFDGIVQLSGFVATNDQKQRAGDLAQSVDGVSRVVNNITMKPQMNQTQMAPTGKTNNVDRTYQSDQSDQSNTNQNQSTQ